MDKFDLFKLWLYEGLKLFETDPANTKFQKGFLAALQQCKEKVEKLQD